MGQMWHRGVGLAVLAFASACGGGDAVKGDAPAGTDPETESTEGTESTDDGRSDALLEFAIDGRTEPLGAQAKLDVRQGFDSVHLGITGADTGSDLVVFDIYFPGIESTMGEHVLPLGLPDQVDYFANVNLDGEPYYSQGGEIVLSLSEDGSIEGSFSVELARDQSVPGAPLEPLMPSDEVMVLTGAFHGQWILSCQSRFPGHESLMQGGVFCESLEF
jgi:hypothetical protein